MNDRLFELYRGVAVHANADLEHNAALELLALVMAADRVLDQAEIDAIKDISDDWRDGDFTFDKYLGPAIVRAQDAITKGEVVELIEDIDTRIVGGDWKRLNRTGCSLVWGHPQGPTLTRSLIEALEEAVDLGGGRVLIFGCAAGDVGIAALFEVGETRRATGGAA